MACSRLPTMLTCRSLGAVRHTRSATAISSSALFHAGDLDFKEPELSELRALARAKPTVLVLHLDRPTVMPELVEECAGVVAVFGASDAAVDDVLRGRVRAEGRLPFELPRSMEAVRAQQPDVPHDSEDPLFPIGYGLEL